MGSAIEMIAGANGCDIYGVGTHAVTNIRSLIAEEEGTTLTAVTFRTQSGGTLVVSGKNYLTIPLVQKQLITFEHQVVSFTIGVGSVTAYKG